MQQNINLDMSQTSAVTCDDCSGVSFEQALVMRKASGLLTGTGQPSYIPIPVFTCKNGGHVNEEFLPKEVKDLG